MKKICTTPEIIKYPACGEKLHKQKPAAFRIHPQPIMKGPFQKLLRIQILKQAYSSLLFIISHMTDSHIVVSNRQDINIYLSFARYICTEKYI